MMYEAVAAGGKAALIMYAIYPFSNDGMKLMGRECMTDNPTRTVSRVKELLNKYG
jgi:transcriptional/translational regulatory protein YebC/TACO1